MNITRYCSGMRIANSAYAWPSARSTPWGSFASSFYFLGHGTGQCILPSPDDPCPAIFGQVAGFKTVKAAGIGTYQIFMETYHHKTYARVHPHGADVEGPHEGRVAGEERQLAAFDGAGDDHLGIAGPHDALR